MFIIGRKWTNSTLFSVLSVPHAACILRCLTCQGRADTEIYGSITSSIKLINRSLNTILKALAELWLRLSPSEKATPSYSSLTAATNWGWLLPKRNSTLFSATKVQINCRFAANRWNIHPRHTACDTLSPLPIWLFRHPLQKNTSVVLCKQDGSAGRHDLCKGLPDVVFGEHSRQTLAHLVRYRQGPLWVVACTWFINVTQIYSLKT